MEGAPENIITAALDDLEQGYDIDEILSRYPQAREQLRPILETAADLSTLAPRPSPRAQRASRARFLAEAERLRQREQAHDRLPPWRRLFYSFGSVALVFALLAVIIIPPSGDAIPGDLLYPIKRSAESVQLFIATQEEEDALRESYEQERNREVYEMLEIGRDGKAGYVGVVKAVTPDYWEIGHITAYLTDDTEISGDPQVGARVEAHCLLEDGQVFAESLQILEPPVEIGPPQGS